MHTDVVLYGPAYSTYTRTVRLALEEKSIAYRLKEVDFIRGENRTPEHLARHPFGKVPVLQHGDFMLHETAAITCYVDRVFDGIALQPENNRKCAQMLEIIGIIVSYIYPEIIVRIVVERLIKPLVGREPDEAVIGKGAERLERGLGVLERCMGDDAYLLGDSISLADLYLIPMWAFFLQTPEGRGGVWIPQRLDSWWAMASERPSVVGTQAVLE